MTKVLIVDDDLRYAGNLKIYLETNSIQAIDVVVALTVEEGLAKLTDDMSVVIADIHLDTPVDGIAFLEEVKRRNDNIGRLILTGYQNDVTWVKQTPDVWRLSKSCEPIDILFDIIRLSEQKPPIDPDRVLDEMVRCIRDASINTSDIERKLNGLLSNGRLSKLESKMDTLAVNVKNVERLSIEHEGFRRKMEDMFNVKVDGVCSFYHKFLMGGVYAVLGGILTIVGKIILDIFIK